MFEFQKLEVYKKAKSFHLHWVEILKENKTNKTTNDQLTRASFRIALNIAEGSGHFSKPERRNFFVISRGSVFECVSILDILHDAETIETGKFQSLLLSADELSRILYAMIKNLAN